MAKKPRSLKIDIKIQNGRRVKTIPIPLSGLAVGLIFTGGWLAALLAMTVEYRAMQPQIVLHQALHTEQRNTKIQLQQVSPTMHGLRELHHQNVLALRHIASLSPLGGMWSTASNIKKSQTTANPNTLVVQTTQLAAQLKQRQLAFSELGDDVADTKQQLAYTPSIQPIENSWISSRFGRRQDPWRKQWVHHKGVDFGGYIGMPVIAPADGVVVWTGSRGGYGRTVVIDHGYGLQTHFAHLSAYRVKRAERVQRGQIIANVGNSGRSTGPHLHYEIRRHGTPIDPEKFMLQP